MRGVAKRDCEGLTNSISGSRRAGVTMEGESHVVSFPKIRVRQWSLAVAILFKWTKLFTENAR